MFAVYRQFIKPFLDRLIALIALVILSPVFGVLYILVWQNMGRPVFFGQERPGLNETIFTMYKFRTMTNDCDENGQQLPDSKRLTPFGRFLRSSSLDELPELLNVVRGNMSLVGPRPLRTQYLPHYTNEERVRFAVKPGITGLAQISGRTSIDWDTRLEYDVEYVQNLSFLLDVRILLLTFIKVMRRDDTDVHLTLQDFDVERQNRSRLPSLEK